MKKDTPTKTEQIAALRLQVEELTKALEESKKKDAMWYSSYQEKSKEIDRIHASLDIFPFAPRYVEVKTSYSTDTKEIGIEGRLMAVLAKAGGLLTFERQTDVSVKE